MPTMNVRDNENNRWKRNAKTKNKTKNKNQKPKIKNIHRTGQGGTEAIVKAWELNDFVLHLS